MLQIGDVIDGYCPRCRLNTYQIVSATDGREVFTATCRTCRNTFAWKPEVSIDELREKNVKKLRTMVRKKAKDMVTPSIVTFASRKNREAGELDMPRRAYREMHGRDPESAPPPVGPQAILAAAAEEKAKLNLPPPEPPPAGTPIAPTVRWQNVTANLSARDGRPYNATRTYKIGDVLLHKTHGLGVVETVVHDKAVMVLFRDTQTVLEMGAPQQFDR